MTSGGFHVSTEDLKSHAATVNAIADSVEEAASAASTERAGGMVYGVLFDPWVQPALNAWADHIQKIIENSAEVGHGIGAGLASNAETYDTIEQANTTTISDSGQGH